MSNQRDHSDVAVEGSGAGRVELPQVGPPFARATAEVLRSMEGVSAATATATLHKMGVRHTYLRGPRALDPTKRVVGSALTLAFMPQREDIAAPRGQEHFERRTALWAVLDEVQPGDVLVVQAFGDELTGCIGEMLTRYLRARGGAGIVVDGGVRDAPKLAAMGFPVWATSVTPHYATQGDLFPWGYHLPIACGGALVVPGDVIVADADGAVVVPAQLAAETARVASSHESWEAFSRERLDQGGRLSKYYPLDEEATIEYETWRRARSEARRETVPVAYGTHRAISEMP